MRGRFMTRQFVSVMEILSTSPLLSECICISLKRGDYDSAGIDSSTINR